MGKTSVVKLPPGMTAFPRTSERADQQKRRMVGQSQMLRTLALRQLGRSKNSKKKTEKKTEDSELDPVKLGMGDLCRLFDGTPITPMVEGTPMHGHRFVIFFDREQVADLGNLKLAVLRLRVNHPLGDIKDVADEVGSSSTARSSSRVPVAVRELHAARSSIVWNMKFGGMDRQENLLDVKDQQAAMSLKLWGGKKNPWSALWASDLWESDL